MVLQVRGDAVYMTHEHDEQAEIFRYASFRDALDLGVAVTERERGVVWEAACQTLPPRAATQREVVENCQGWTVRVVQRLVELGMVSAEKVEMLKGMMEPV